MHKIRFIFAVAALWALSAVLLAAFSASAKKDVVYIGSKECIICHGETHGKLIEAHAKTAHAKAMVDATANPDAVVAKFEDGAPVQKSDIAYVLGSGKVYQNYLGKDLNMLPGKWLVKEQKWVEAEQKNAVTQCVGCHVTNFDPDGKTWTELGVGCESCHGPGGDHAESMEATDIVNLKKLDTKKANMVCGQCHSVGTDPSGKYAYPTTFLPGNDLNEHFKLGTPAEGQVNSQYNDFIASKHAEGGMKCTTCHDTHGDKAKAEHQLRKPVNELCMPCHKATIESMEKHAPGAAETDNCATCHMLDGSHRFEKAKPK